MANVDFERVVEQYYQPLYQLGLSLTKERADAADLVQGTFLTWAEKGQALRDSSKAKDWLSTTLYRRFRADTRRSACFEKIAETIRCLSMPYVLPAGANVIDRKLIQAALLEIKDCYRAAIILFYIEGNSYQEIADILNIPLGSVMSRISRGREQIRDRVGELENHANRAARTTSKR